MTELILLALFTLAFRLRGQGEPKNPQDTDIGKLNKPIFWLVSIAMFLPYYSWWFAVLVGSAIVLASRPSWGEQYGKILGNMTGGFDTDHITNVILPAFIIDPYDKEWEKDKRWFTIWLWKTYNKANLIKAYALWLHNRPILWAHSGLITRGVWFSLPLIIMGQYLIALCVPIAFYLSFLIGGKFYGWKGGEYLFGFIYGLLLLVNLW